MENEKIPLKGLIILKRLNTKESERGVELEDTEYVFASEKYPDIIRKLCKFPKNRLSWLIVANFRKNEKGKLEYSEGISGLAFLEYAQKYLERQAILN